MLPIVFFLLAAPLSAATPNLPSYFEPNRGQAPQGVSFLARGPGYSVQVHPTGAAIALDKGSIDMQLLHSRPSVTVRGSHLQEGISSYFTHPDESKWLRNIPHYGRVELEDVYPGIDLLYYGNGREIEYDFVIAPGADPRQIRFLLGNVRLAPNGDLLMQLPGGQLRHRKPLAWQDNGRRRLPVRASYRLQNGEISFALGPYDRNLPLTIDPSIAYASYAGSGFGWTFGVAVDPSGASYYSGRLVGLGGPGGGVVVKLNPSGSAISYIAYLGDVEPRGITVNSLGAVYLTGYATGNLALKNALQSTVRGGADMFISKIVPAGNDLEFSTYYGGSGDDYGFRIAVDASGGVHALGVTNSTDFPAVSAARGTLSGPTDLALVKLNETASRAIFSTYLGSNDLEPFVTQPFPFNFGQHGLALDRSGNIVVSGSGNGTVLPLVNPLLTVPSGRFMIRLNTIGTVIQSTWLPAGGGPVVLDSLDNIFIAGSTSNLLAGPTVGAACLVRISPSGGDFSLIQNFNTQVTFYGIAVDPSNNIYVTGSAQSGAAFPEVRAMQTRTPGQSIVLAKVNSTGSIVYSTYYGGSLDEEALGVAADSSGAAYLAGYSYSSDLPLVNPVATRQAHFNDGIFVKIIDADSNITIVPVTITTAPPGLQVIVDGVTSTAPVNVSWTVGSTHTLSTNAFQSNGSVRYRYLTWLNTGTLTQTVTAPTTATTYTAAFQQEVQLIADVFPAGRGTVMISPSSTDGYYAVGLPLTATALPAPGATFVGWTGSISSTTNPVTIVTATNGTQPFTVLANFTGGTSITGGLGFVPVTPCRLIDTRGVQRITGNTTRDINVLGGPCGIPSTAKAYSMNATVIPQRGLAYLTLFPTGQSRPLVSTLNAFEGQTIANAAIVPSGNGGQVSAYVTDDTDLILDINGYFTDSTGPEALVFFPMTPCRIIDTRPDAGGPGGVFGPPALVGGVPRSFPILQSSCGIPLTARAYAFNVTVVPFGPLDYIAAYPTSGTVPGISTQNSPNGRVLANMAIVAGSNTGGGINLYAPQSTHAVVDINGYFAPAAAGGLRFYTLTPCRLADTRDGNYPVPNGPPSIAAATTRTFTATGRCSVPAAAQGFSVNATVIPPGYLGFVTLYPGPIRPFVSTLNAWEGQVAANAALVPAGSGGNVNVFVSNSTDFVLDINGYFAP